MKLSDLDVEDVVAALRHERSKWIDVAAQEKRRHTESERTTISLLSAIENVIAEALARSAKTR